MSGEDWLDFNETDVARFVGKTILVGITYVDHDNRELERRQWFGRIARITKAEGIVVDLDDSDEPCTLPPALNYLRPAKPGTYRLKSTGRVIEDPDFLMTWTCQEPPPGRERTTEPE